MPRSSAPHNENKQDGPQLKGEAPNHQGWVFRLLNVKSNVGPTELCGSDIPPPSAGHPPSMSSSGTSWMYSAPGTVDWSLQSHALLSITYRSKAQGLPAYTNISATSDYLHRGLTCSSGGRDEHDDTGTCFGGGGCCCRAYSRCLQKIGIGPRPVQIHKEVYAAADVVRTEELEDGVAIRGFPSCKCLRVYLKPKIKRRERFGAEGTEALSGSSSNTMGTVASAPSSSAGATIELSPSPSTISRDQQQGEDKSHRDYLGGEPTTDDFIVKNGGGSVDSLQGSEPWINGNADKQESKAIRGPILTFAILAPKSDPTDMTKDCPPLLWKVTIPPDPSICVETLTVLEGMLEVNGSREPTAVYLNGYQSWSYAGTVMRGHPQPTSAMPHILSRAFNRGATVPPRPTKCARYNDTGGGIQRIPNYREDWDDNDPRDDSDPLISGSISGCGDGIGAEDGDDDIERHFYRSDLYACVTSAKSSAVAVSSHSAHSVNAACSGDNEEHKDDALLASLTTGPALVLGLLSQKKQFGVVTLCPDLRDLSIQCSLDGTVPSRSEGISSDWCYAQIIPDGAYDEEPTIHYINAVAAHNDARPMRHGVLLTGWCSWYHYYENIEECTLRQTFETLEGIRNKIASNVALIDDGYMTAWGDWGSLKPKAFPTAFRLCPHPTEQDVDSCMRSLADSIRANGMKPGIWLAPFAADKHSKLAKENPEWIIRNYNGRPANSSNCGKFFYGLDASNPSVREHVFNTLKRATTVWGFECLKLDFLYAAALKGNGKYDVTMSRAEAMDLALRCLRAGAGPTTFIIGCGCPLGTAVGYIDGMRVSADTGPTWYPAFPLPSWDNSTLPSLRAMIRNSITRSNLGHRWWHNDPDCILLGETTELTDEEVVSAATVVGMTGGMMLMSDDLTKLRYNRLRIITRVYPVTGASAVAIDLHRPSPVGIPSLLRLWCTDEYDDVDKAVFATTTTDCEGGNGAEKDHNALAVRTAQSVAFNPDRATPNPSLRMRSRVCVARGLGCWSVVSLSNWSDKPATVAAPISVFLPPSLQTRSGFEKEELNYGSEPPSIGRPTAELGFHVLAFWSSKYIWIPKKSIDKQRSLSKRLDPRETEIFHVKPVLDVPQYIGSDIHFTCGYEVRFFKASEHRIELGLKNYCRRSGYVFLFVPKGQGNIKATVNGKPGEFEVIASPPLEGGGSSGRVVRVWATIRGTESDGDGLILLEF